MKAWANKSFYNHMKNTIIGVLSVAIILQAFTGSMTKASREFEAEEAKWRHQIDVGRQNDVVAEQVDTITEYADTITVYRDIIRNLATINKAQGDKIRALESKLNYF